MTVSCGVGGRAVRGFTLLEVLIALIVLSIGLLGLSGLQTTSLRNNHSAFLRSQATLVTNDIIDRMRANRDAAVDGAYDIGYEDATPAGDCSVMCASANAVANADLAIWRSYVQRLPGGEGSANVDADDVAEIRVRWTDTRDANNTLEIVTRSQI